MSKPTADWDKVGDRFYRKTQLYTSVFDQDLELENYVIAGAPYSGAVGRRDCRLATGLETDARQLSFAMKRRCKPIVAR